MCSLCLYPDHFRDLPIRNIPPKPGKRNRICISRVGSGIGCQAGSA